ncbi:methyltransferase domain-containing protein [Aliikangiella sp. IMCC44359]|uniref:methyltransferase domain-containing protein n=1 Tax=Aliikangiella sp. IMCC44359 TaxID=3459125 RepID=UPI00403AE1AE
MARFKKIDQLIIQFIGSDNLPIIDLRATDDYESGHIIDSSHFPQSELFARLFQLPSKNIPLKLVGKCSQLKLVCEDLLKKNYLVDKTLVWSEEVKNELIRLNFLETGLQSKRLWRPAKVLERFISNFPYNVQRKRALDIAAGSGRDAVFLAMNGWDVSAVDYLPQAINKIGQLAELHQVSVKQYLLDLELEEKVLNNIKGLFDLIVVVRYLHRPLLEQIKQKINPGGFLVYQTFMEGCELFGKPKNPRYLLAEGELAKVFKGFEIIKDEVEYLEDGRPTNTFVARKNISIS